MLLGLSACGNGNQGLHESSSSSKDVSDKSGDSKQPETSGKSSESGKASETSEEGSAESDSENIPGQSGALDKDKEYKILFIGNS